MGGDMKPAHYVRGEGGEANSMYGYRGARGERPHVVWAILLALTRVLIVVDSACAESDIYGYVGANGVFELTNVPTERRFRPAESQARRLSHRVSVEEVTEGWTATPGNSTCIRHCFWPSSRQSRILIPLRFQDPEQWG